MDLIQEGSQFRVVKSRPDDNVPKRMTHKAEETKQKVFFNGNYIKQIKFSVEREENQTLFLLESDCKLRCDV